MNQGLAIPLEITDELLDVLAERVAARLADRTPEDTQAGFLDVPGAAQFLACPTSRIYSLVSAGRLPVHRDGSRLLFDPQELRTYVNQGGAKRP